MNKKLVIERTFNAPIDKVWQAFTTPEILVKWWFPEGMSNSYVSVDASVGGEFRYCFKNQEGREFWGKGVYQTLNKPNFLSYIDNFTDEQGNPVPPSYFGMPGDELIPTLLEISLNQVGDKTHMKLIGDNPFDDEITASMTQGWNSMFDHLNGALK